MTSHKITRTKKEHNRQYSKPQMSQLIVEPYLLISASKGNIPLDEEPVDDFRGARGIRGTWGDLWKKTNE